MNNDCLGLAAFADQMAAAFGNDDAKFVQSFGVLTPYIPGEQIAGVAWNTDPVYLGSNQSASGFAAQYQDGFGTNAGANASDQAHHFAAFFQWGYADPPTASWSSTFWEVAQAIYNGSSINQGDLNLGYQAALLGAALAHGDVGLSQIGSSIRSSLCAK
jgi:hypothetical protein